MGKARFKAESLGRVVGPPRGVLQGASGKMPLRVARGSSNHREWEFLCSTLGDQAERRRGEEGVEGFRSQSKFLEGEPSLAIDPV